MVLGLNWETAVLGGLGVVSLVFLAKIMRGGLGTYTEARKKFADHIKKTEEETRTYNRSLPAQEQMAFVRAAVREILDLAGCPEGFAVSGADREVCLSTPEGEIRIFYVARSRRLRSQKRMLHGAPRWEVSGPLERDRYMFEDLMQALNHLKMLISGKKEENIPQELPEFQRRFRH